MNCDEAHQFITNYFKRLFADRDLNALDEYLHPSYWARSALTGATQRPIPSQDFLKDRYVNNCIEKR